MVDTRNKAPVFPDQDDGDGGPSDGPGADHCGEHCRQTKSIGEAVAATDEDTNLTYALGGPDAASFDIVRTSGQLQTKAELDKETKDTYTVTVTAADSLSVSSTITVTIKVTNVDEMPDLEGEAPEEYAENGKGTVARFTADDPEGEPITWSVSGVDSADFSIENGVLRFKSAPDYENPANSATNNIYVVTVQASDGGADTTATEDVTIEVTNVDEPGKVTLSTLQPQVGVDITATLDDPDNVTADHHVSWQWYRGSSPITGAVGGASSTTSTYSPTTGDVGSRLRARAMYDDGEAEDKTAQEDSANGVRRAPTSNTDPVFPDQDLNANGVQTAQSREVAENTAAGRNLGARVAATDPGDVLTYSLSGADAGSFDIGRSSGQLQTKAALDHETKEMYTVTVTATDPFGAPVTSEVTITVTDVNEAPTVSGAASIDHAENGTELDIDAEAANAQAADYTATDEDDADNAGTGLTWRLSGADASKFNITTTGDMRTLSFKANPDYESPGDSGRNNVYEVTVRVTDSKGNSDEQDVTVKVTNVEEDGTVTLSTLQPRVGFPLTATLADADNITAGSVSWQWYKGAVTPDGLAQLDMTGCVDATSSNCFIKGAASDTYTPVAFDVTDTLVAVALYTDGSPNEADAPKDFAMMVTANTVLADTRNKAPVFPDQDDEMEGDQTDQERSVEENTVSGMMIGDPVVAMDSIIAPDTGAATPEILTYALGGTDAGSFTIDRGTAQVSTKAALDKETKDTYAVTVTATDPSGLQSTINVTIKVTEVDEAPMITVGGLVISGSQRVDYAENRRDAVATYMASGPDAASATWSLSGDDAGDFRLNSAGVLTFRATPNYEASTDANTDNVYSVTVEAADDSYTAMHSVTVTVTNEDEPGTVSLSGDPQVGVELTASVTDPDGNVSDVAWQWYRDDDEGGRKPIDGETSETYTPVADDVGRRLGHIATYSDGEGSGKTAGARPSVAVAPEGAGDGYDANGDGTIDRSEVIAAIDDFFDGVITRAEVIEVIDLFFGD